MNETNRSSLFSTYGHPQLAFDHGEGSYLFTDKGEKYLDFAGGVAVNALGHAHPKLVEALTRQAKKLWHVSNLFAIPGQEKLAQRLCNLTFAERVFFNNSGAEAVETAIKTTRRYQVHSGHPGRNRIITFSGAFHGRTLATIAAGGKKEHLQGFAPDMEGFDQIIAGDLDLVRDTISPATAGILIEPVQGEGGVNVLAPSFLRGLRALCDEHDILLIFDEVQTGMGRTGKLFAYEWAGIEPDIMAIAKGIGGGFPLGACLATKNAASGMTAGSHGSTFGGNPLAMAVGNAVLDVVLENGFISDVADKGLYVLQKLAALKDENEDLIADIRGKGLLIGIEFKYPPAQLIKCLADEHVLSVPATHNVVRFLPPLNVSHAQIDEAVTALEFALKKYRKLRSC
jgi:acetylornithine/N-succinyldiaminopimelate aminotransferase